METQAAAPAPAQVQTPVHPIHQEAADLAALTKFVEENPDNDPDHPEDSSTPRGEDGQPTEKAAETPAEEPAVETIEWDEDVPVFEVPDTEDKSKTVKVSLKQLREERMMKADYMRNIQKVKAQEADLANKAKEAQLAAQQEYVQRLEVHKQTVLKTVAPELQGVDLNKLAMEDPAEAQRLFFRQIQVNQTLQGIEQEQRQAADKLNAERQSQFQQAAKQAWETLTAEVPGWNEETYNGLLKFAKDDYGFDATQVVDARLLKVLHDAKQYRSLQKAKPEVAKRVVAVPKVVRPGSAEKPNPAKEAAEKSYDRLKKTGKGEDFMSWYLQKQK
jgi:hypothetical protein